jgi:hypothetical protein
MEGKDGSFPKFCGCPDYIAAKARAVLDKGAARDRGWRPSRPEVRGCRNHPTQISRSRASLYCQMYRLSDDA